MSSIFTKLKESKENPFGPTPSPEASEMKPQRQVVEIKGQEYVISSAIHDRNIVIDTTKADYSGPNKLSGYFIRNGRSGDEYYLDIKLESLNKDCLSYIKIKDMNIGSEKCFVIESASESRLNKKRIITTDQLYLHKYVQDPYYFEDINNDGIEENVPAVRDYIIPVDSIIFWE